MMIQEIEDAVRANGHRKKKGGNSEQRRGTQRVNAKRIDTLQNMSGSWRSQSSSFAGSNIIGIWVYYWFTVLWVVIVLSSLFVQLSESFVLSSTTTTFTFTSTRHLPINHRQHKHQKGHSCQTFVPDVCQSVRRHVGITVLSNQQQNTIEKKEKQLTTKTRRKNRSWEESFQLLVSYKDKHGNCNVPRSYKDDLRLATWVHNQRRTKDRLSHERIAKLDDLGFSWANELCEEQWEEMFQKLVQYAKENNGDCNIPGNNDNNDVNKKLYNWVEKQRRRKSLLSKERQTKLDNIGLIWEDANKVKADQKWNEQYESLKDYKEEHGHCLVPKRWEDDPTLGLWVCTQRQKYRKGQLREDRQTKLEEMDFTWKVCDGRKSDYVKLDLKWFVMYGILLNFLEEHGHCDVPHYYKKDKSLGTWVDHQRVNQKKKILHEDRKERLDDIGFTWNFDNQKHEQWNETYKELKRYKEQNGHLRLPETSRSLIDWVSWQRIQSAAGKVSPERKALLDEIDFRWEIQTRST